MIASSVPDKNKIHRVFGISNVADPDDAARRSPRRFVRGRYQISPFDELRNPKGSVISAFEAFRAYGIDVLDEAIEYGSALLLRHPNSAGDAVRRQREALGLSRKAVSRKGSPGLSEADIERIETGAADDIPYPIIERIAFAIGLDERQIAFNPKVTNIAGRLKTMQTSSPGSGLLKLSPSTVSILTEAASVIRIQNDLQSSLGSTGNASSFEPTDDYGTQLSPAWKIGYELALKTRRRLGMRDEPVVSMRDLVETTLGIPVVQAELPRTIAGVTISVTDGARPVRGIVLNTKGPNDNPLVRRATLAHELGHLLYDPNPELDDAHVDSYMELDIDPQRSRSASSEAAARVDRVEQRANAFAISFLAPVEAVRDSVEVPIGEQHVVDTVLKFGISVTAARFHIRNAYYGNFEVPDLDMLSVSGEDWRGVEDFAIGYFRPIETPITRRGRFAGLVVHAWKRNLLSVETASRYLNCSEDALTSDADGIEAMYEIP